MTSSSTAALATMAAAASSTLSGSSALVASALEPTTIIESMLLPGIDEVLSCRLVGPFSIAVQALVGTLGFSTLVIKRHFERPRRPWLVWYVLNLTLDCTVGILFITGYLRLFGYLARRLHVKGLESGQYGDPPSWRRWVKQASIFCASMVCMKLTVVMLISLFPVLVGIGDLILKPVQLTHSPRFEIIFVMAVWPLTLNIFESWVIDQFIKKKGHQNDISTAEGHLPLTSGDENHRRMLFGPANTLSLSSASSDSRTLGSHSARGTRLSIEMSEFDLAEDDAGDSGVAKKHESELLDRLFRPSTDLTDMQAIRLAPQRPSPDHVSALLLPTSQNPFSDSEQDDLGEDLAKSTTKSH
ncbi:hypothetical protein EV174_003448 [Coemansia sp. RSA 2320]|nr:hypothetical protein EV174_003448 [Coemansia sp. RSA 2320]